MRSATPKHLHPLLGRRLSDWVIEAARALGPDPLVVVTSRDASDAFEGETVAVQEEPRGTGDAAAAARSRLEEVDGDVLVVTGGAAEVTSELLAGLLDAHRSAGAAATVLSFEPAEPGAYGRIVRDGEGALRAIVEARDASEEELAIREVNSSIYVFEAAKLWPALERLEPQNAQGELYLTDTVRDLVAAGEPVAVYKADDPADAEGVNTRAELAAAAAPGGENRRAGRAAAAGVRRAGITPAHMPGGATIVDPATTWIDPTV